jgi:pimeloyl-ACP methyl ester carboxylesterase
MAGHASGDADAGDRFVQLDDGDMHVVENGKPGAPALLLLSNAAAPTACWDPVVPLLAGAHRVVRVDLLGHGRSTSPPGGYDIPTQARRVAAALDRLGVSRVTVIGHSSGCTVATAGVGGKLRVPPGASVAAGRARGPGRLFGAKRGNCRPR